MNKITVGVLTVSDRCDKLEAVDESGPNLVRLIRGGVVRNGTVERTGLVPDSEEKIERVLKEWSDSGLHLILTTGGTGIAERDVTPEATAAVLERTIPGISQLMFKRSSEVTPLAALSRGIAGVRGKSLIINFPGSKKASQECLEAVAGVIPHAVDLLIGRREEVSLVHDALGEKKSSVAEGAPAQRNRESPYPCISVKEAQQTILGRIYLLRKEKVVHYEQAQGYVLTQDVVARDDHPPFNASLKDGYAVLSVDEMHERQVMRVSHAGGTLPETKISAGHCVRVSTGAAIPAGADAVVEVEKTSVTSVTEDGKEEKTIVLETFPASGQDIRKKGSDFKVGQLLLSSGTYLDSPAVGLLATAGVTSVRVYDRPIVAVISTGDELVNPDENVKPGKVRDSNRIMLTSLLKEENFRALDHGIASDHPDSLRNALEKAFRAADVVVTSGSMSMGERDYLKEVLVSDFNAEICFGRVHMKPGKPTSFAVVTFDERPKLWFGLPGNPASALVTAHLFLLPALRKISGLQKTFPMELRAVLRGKIVPEDRPQYARAVLTWDESTDRWSAEVTGDQISSRIGSCVNANCFVEIPGKGFLPSPSPPPPTPPHSSTSATTPTPTPHSAFHLGFSGTTGTRNPEAQRTPATPQGTTYTVKAFLIGKSYT